LVLRVSGYIILNSGIARPAGPGTHAFRAVDGRDGIEVDAVGRIVNVEHSGARQFDGRMQLAEIAPEFLVAHVYTRQYPVTDSAGVLFAGQGHLREAVLTGFITDAEIAFHITVLFHAA